MRFAGIKWLFVALGLSLAIVAGPSLGIGAANAQSGGLELLSRATKSYEAGAYSDAAGLVDSAFKAGLTGELAARAILLRGEINERGGAYAKALQDYSNALWMETLPAADRKKATEGKERVMAAMGLNSSSAVTQASATSAAPATSGSSSSGVFGFLSGVFSGSEAAQPPRPAETQQNTQASSPPADAAASQPKAPNKAAAKPVKVAHAKPAAQASAEPSSSLSVSAASGEYLIVFGSANSEASGRSTAKALKAQVSDILVHRELDVAQRAGGGFQIQAGPYKTKSPAIALCSAMQQRGVQCRVTP